MNYFEWWGDLDAIGAGFPASHFGAWWMVEGRPVTGWDDGVVATYTDEDVLSSNFGLAENSWPICSKSMRICLESHAPGLVQFLPFQLARPDGSGKVGGFCVCQILGLVDCLDRSRTKVRNQWEPVNDCGDFGVFRPISLSRSLIGNECLFRIKGKCSSIVIREDLKNAIEAAGFVGQRFDAIECCE